MISEIQDLLEDLKKTVKGLPVGKEKTKLLKEIDNLLTGSSSKKSNDYTTTYKQDEERKKLITKAKGGVKGTFWRNVAAALDLNSEEISKQLDSRYTEDEQNDARAQLDQENSIKEKPNTGVPPSALIPPPPSIITSDMSAAEKDAIVSRARNTDNPSNEFTETESALIIEKISSMTEQIKDVIKISKEIEKKLNNDSILRKSDMEKLLNQFSKLTEPKDKSKDNTSSVFTAEQDEQQETLKKALTQALEKIISENPTLLQCSGGGLFNPFGRNPSGVPAPKPSSPTAIKPVPTNLQVDKNGKPLTGINLERREAKLAKIAANVTPAAASAVKPGLLSKVGGRLGAGAGGVLSLLFAAQNFKSRKEVGQSNTEAAIGTAGGVAGGIAGAAAGGALGALGGPLAPVTVPLGALLGGIAGSMGGGAIADKGIEMSRNNTPAATEIKAPDLIARNSVPGGVNIVKGNIDTKNQLVEQKKIIKNIEKSTDPKKQKPNVINNITNVSQKMPEKIKTGNEENTFNRLIAQDFEHPSMHSNFNMG